MMDLVDLGGSRWLWAWATAVVVVGTLLGVGLSWLATSPSGASAVPSPTPGQVQPEPGPQPVAAVVPIDEATAVEQVVAEPEAPVPATPTPGSEPPATLDVDCAAAEVRCVALTFDDGPARHTGELLDTLAEAGVPATFFVTGVAAQAHPEVVARMQELGMEVGLHGWDHALMTGLGPDAQRSQLERSVAVLAAAGVEAPRVYRPAYGEYDAVTLDLGWPVVLWDVDTRDWEHRDSDKVVSGAMSAVREGSIVLMHDLHASTVQAVPELLEQLAEQGYTPVTVSTLLGTGAEPGSVHRRASLSPTS